MRLTFNEIKELVEGARLDSRGKNVYGICPSCGHDEFGVALLEDNHPFACFRKNKCGFAGNIYTLLTFLGKSRYSVQPGYTPRARLENKLNIEDVAEKIDLTLVEYPLPLGFKRFQYGECPYLEGRGFDKEDYEKYKPGYTTLESRLFGFVIFPIKSSEMNVGFVARNTKSKQEIEDLNVFYKLKGVKKTVKRYINSNSDFAKILGGVEEITDQTTTVILVEGLFDKKNTDKVLSLDTQQEVKCCCTWKCAVSEEQIFLLQQSGVTTVILLYDPDVVEDTKKAGFELDPYFEVFIGYNEKGADPGDMMTDEFDDVLSTLKSPFEFSVKKMNRNILRKKL